MFKYLEIVEDSTSKVVKRMGVTSKTDRQIQKLENGLELNLNHAEYTVEYHESKVELPIIG